MWDGQSPDTPLFFVSIASTGLFVFPVAFGISLWILAKATELLRERPFFPLPEDERSRMYSTLKHEAGSALQIIIGYSHLLLAEPGPEKQRTMLKRLAENSDLLYRIINDLTEPHPTRENRNRPSLQNIRSFFRNIVSDFEMTHGFRIGPVQLDIDDTVPASAGFDGHLLRQALSNLLRNAAIHG